MNSHGIENFFIHLQYTPNILYKNSIVLYHIRNSYVWLCMNSYYLPRIVVITIMRFLEDEVSDGDKLIPFLVTNDVFELDPENGNIKCLRKMFKFSEIKMQHICLDED